MIIVIDIITGISNIEAVNLLQNTDLNKKVDQKIITLNETEIEKHKFHQHKNSVLIYDVNMNKT